MNNWHQRHKADLTLGQRAADVLRNSMGSWFFVFGFLGFMSVWAAGNGTHGFDPFPFILLNLFLSMLAGLQGAILLIAAKRQDAVAGAMAQHDYEVNVAAKAELDELKSTQVELHNLISECHRILTEQETP